MACFVVPVAEAVIVTVAAKVLKSKEKNTQTVKLSAQSAITEKKSGIPFSKKLNWLSYLLWGGSALLAFEHLWHGEIVPFFPFLSAASTPESTAVMLGEMATVGVTMMLTVTVVWLCMLAVAHTIEKKAKSDIAINKEEQSA